MASFYYGPAVPAPIGISSPISSFVVFDTSLIGALQVHEPGFYLPYIQGDRLAFQVGYDDATFASLGLSVGDLKARIKSTPSAMFSPVAIDTVRKVLLFAITMQVAWGCTEIEIVPDPVNLYTFATNGTFESPITPGQSSITGITVVDGEISVQRGTGFGATTQYLRIINGVDPGPTIGDNGIIRSVLTLQCGVTYRITFDVIANNENLSNAFFRIARDTDDGQITSESITQNVAPRNIEVLFTVPQVDILTEIPVRFEWYSLVPGVPVEPNQVLLLDNITIKSTNLGALGTSNSLRPGILPETHVISYRNQTDAYGASYQQDTAYYQEVRLPMYLYSLGNETEDDVYTLPNQQQVVTSSRMGRAVRAQVGPLPDRLAEAFQAASGHTDTRLDGRQVRISEVSPEDLARANSQYPLRAVSATIRDNEFVAQSLLG